MPSGKLTDRQTEIVRYIRDHLDVHGYAPSIREVATWVGLTPQGASDELAKMESLGVLKRTPGIARGIRLTPVDKCQD